MGDTQLTIAEVKEGNELPELEVDVSATTVILGALASRDWRPMHHDRDFAVHRNGTRDIFMNTPNLAAWFERYVTDWTGPRGRLGRMRFRMHDSIFPGDHIVFQGTVKKVETADDGCAWADVELQVTRDGNTMTSCSARVALPGGPDDNPWARRGDAWRP